MCESSLDLRRARGEAAAALELAEHAGDDALLALVLARWVSNDFLCGSGVDETLTARALALEEKLADDLPLDTAPSMVIGLALAYIGDIDRAEQLLTRHLERAERRGDEYARLGLLLYLGCIAHRRGDLATVERLCREQEEVSAQIGDPQSEAYGAFGLMYACTELGREAEARVHAEKALSHAVRARATT